MKLPILNKTVRPLWGLAASLVFCAPGTYSQTVDIAEFLLLEPGHTWELSGTASWSGYELPIAATIVTEVGETLHGVETTKLSLSGAASLLFLSVNIEQTVSLSLTPTHLVLHSRVGRITGSLNDEDIEVYNTPAQILPRLVTVGESYLYTADLESGSYDDSVLFESIESIDTALGSVEAMKLVVFSEDDTPLTLWLGRDNGYMQAGLTTTVDGEPLTVFGNLAAMDRDFEANQTVSGLWSGTVGYGDGWRYSDWLSYFWVPYLNSSWIQHLGMGWVYCIGTPSTLWMYISGVGWFWGSEAYYPWMFSATHGRYLQNSPGSLWFFDPDTGEWIDLAP